MAWGTPRQWHLALCNFAAEEHLKSRTGMEPRASWEAWERGTALRMLQALEAASAGVHDAVQAVMECCLQLHPAAAESLYSLTYEAAKKARTIAQKTLSLSLPCSN